MHRAPLSSWIRELIWVRQALEFSDSRINASVSKYINIYSENVDAKTDIYVETAGGEP